MEVEDQRRENLKEILKEMLKEMLKSTMKEEVVWVLNVEWPFYQICRF